MTYMAQVGGGLKTLIQPAESESFLVLLLFIHHITKLRNRYAHNVKLNKPQHRHLKI